jgi:ribosomal protein S18 acetylase RimI-like enzyme
MGVNGAGALASAPQALDVQQPVRSALVEKVLKHEYFVYGFAYGIIAFKLNFLGAGQLDIEIKGCAAGDLTGLRSFARRAFCDTFAAMNTPENIKKYINAVFGMSRMKQELADKDTSFYLLFADSVLAGYIKLNESGAQTDIRDPLSLEIERIYVSKQQKRRGLGSALMDRAVSEARLRGKAYLWLGVWEKNEAAIRFYMKHGFNAVGTHGFLLGDDAQTDVILRRDIRQA